MPGLGLERGKHVSRVNDNGEHCAQRAIRLNCPLIVLLILGVSHFVEHSAFRIVPISYLLLDTKSFFLMH